MKVLALADLHYTLPQWDWVCDNAGRFDLVVVAGDLLEISSTVPLEVQIVVVRKYLRRMAARAPLMVASGNHDILPKANGQGRDAAWLQKKMGIGYLADGECFETEAMLFSILPWWESAQDRRDTLVQLEQQSQLLGDRRWIWIYHPPPEGSPVAWNGRRDLGDPHLSNWIQRFQPWIVFGGHIHNAPFYAQGSWVDRTDNTWVFNSGRQIGPTPVFTVFEFDRDRAVWIAADAAEQVKLSEPLERLPLG